MVVVVGDGSCSVLLLAVVCYDGPLRGGLAGGRVEDSKQRRLLLARRGATRPTRAKEEHLRGRLWGATGKR